jgi:RNA polymerase sigma-70 factor (ECF subfamily)
VSLPTGIGREPSGTERPANWIGEQAAPRSESTENLRGRGFVDRTAHKQFAAVFEPHLVDAYRLARWLTGSRADADDIVQEAALRAFRGIAGFSGGNPRAWVLTIVRNAAYTWFARNRPKVVVLADDLDEQERDRIANLPSTRESGGDDPEATLIAAGAAEEVRRRVAALPTPFAEVLVLREIHELSYSEIAAMLNLPIGTVMSRLARARRLLTERSGS